MPHPTEKVNVVLKKTLLYLIFKVPNPTQCNSIYFIASKTAKTGTQLALSHFMITLILTLIFSFQMNAFASATPPASLQNTSLAPLLLEIGEQRILHFESLYRFSVSGNSIRHIRIPNQNQILIKAIKPGISELTLFTSKTESETRTIRVEAPKQNLHSQQILRALNSLNETEVIEAGEHYILRGKVHGLKEAQSIAYLREHFAKSILDESKIDHALFEKSKAELQTLLANYPSLELTTDEGLLWVTGALPSQPQADAILKRIKSIQPLTFTEIQTIKDSTPTIYFKVFLLEVKKTQMGSIGIECPEKIGSTLQITPLQLLFNKQLDLTIHTLSQNGALKILSSPELVVRAPGQAELFAGGELPIRQRSKFSDSVNWKSFGLSLKLDVKEFGGEKVRLNIETEMSHLDRSQMNDEIPAIQSNRIKTQVDGTMGKPLLLSGLLQDGLRSEVKGFPGFSQIPILGKLFSSEDYQNDRSELVAVLLPRRNPPETPLSRIYPHSPKGYLPEARNELSQDEIEKLQKSRYFPWNVL